MSAQETVTQFAQNLVESTSTEKAEELIAALQAKLAEAKAAAEKAAREAEVEKSYALIRDISDQGQAIKAAQESLDAQIEELKVARNSYEGSLNRLQHVLGEAAFAQVRMSFVLQPDPRLDVVPAATPDPSLVREIRQKDQEITDLQEQLSKAQREFDSQGRENLRKIRQKEQEKEQEIETLKEGNEALGAMLESTQNVLRAAMDAFKQGNPGAYNKFLAANKTNLASAQQS